MADSDCSNQPNLGKAARAGSAKGNPVCMRCHRAISNLKSIKAGLGPACRSKAGRSAQGKLFDENSVLNDVGTLQEVGLVCRKLADGRLACNVPHIVKYHSPTGFACGYAGSGPSELALNVLHLLLPRAGDYTDLAFGATVVSNDAARLYHDFKREFIATMPKDGGYVPIEKINEWLASRLLQEAT